MRLELSEMSTKLLYLYDTLFRCIDHVAGCTLFVQAGDGKKRGTCNENFNCHADGICKPTCTVQGSKGDGISRGSCNEGRICFHDGSCKVPGLILRSLFDM